MTRDQAIAKIKKCLALSKSSNPHEAAAGMRQAQKLMAEHAVSDGDALLSDVTEKACTTRTKSHPMWETYLACLIANAFGCSHIWTSEQRYLPSFKIKTDTRVIFVGVGAAPEVAGYAWDVLSRQCANSRLEHLRAQPARCKPITLTARGDAFAKGWVLGVRNKVEQLAGTERNDLLIEQYKAARWPNSQKFDPKDRTVGRNVSNNDVHQGIKAGQKARLDRGLGTAGPLELLT